ncbi:MAG: hypothetical protein WBQ32_10605 [Ignavibacteriaceae bacterium]
MKTIFFLILLSLSLFAQDSSMSLRGNEIKLGMTVEQVWDDLESDLNVVEDINGNFYISDKYDAPVGIIVFKNEIVVKIMKDWGTTFKNNVGQVFKTLWNIFKQYDKELDAVKVLPLETYSPKGDKTTLQFYISENRFIDVAIQHSVTIYEIVEEKEN